MKISKAALVKAVKEKCRDCCMGELTEVKACDCTHCPLVPVKNLFFNGENHVEVEKSNRGVRELSPEHKAALAAGRERKRLEKSNSEAHI
jgi:hypothetical protein